jgi:hypothetical protein
MPVIYLDTFVYSALTDDRRANLVAASLCRMVAHHGAEIGLSPYNLFELHQATRQHSQLSKVLRMLPVVLLRGPGYILKNELECFPNRWFGDVRLCQLSHPALRWRMMPSPISFLLSNHVTALMSKEMKRQAALAKSQYSQTFPAFFQTLKAQNLIAHTANPDDSGLYKPKHARLFADINTFQQVSRKLGLSRDGRERDMSSIRSLWISAQMQYWKFYNAGKTPEASGDLADQHHSKYYPYCSAVVTERHGAEILRKIKPRYPDLLADVDVLTLRELTDRYGCKTNRGAK